MRRSTALTAALLLVAAAAYMSIAAAASVEERSEEETRRMFRDWMVKVDKTYDSIGEEEHRYAVFKEKLRGLDKHGTSVDAAGLPNGFGDLTREELRSRRTCGTVITTKDKEKLRSLNLGWIEKVKRFNFQLLGPHY